MAEIEASNITTQGMEKITKLAKGLPQIISVAVTFSVLALVIGIVYGVYRLFCKTRSEHDEDNVENKVFYDQFDVNCSQMNIEPEEHKFVNPAAKISSESESCSSNVSSSTTPASSSISKLVKPAQGDRFAVSKVSERSSSPSPLKIKIPKQFVQTSAASNADDQFAIALIDHKSNTIHNLDLSDCVIVNTQGNSVITPTSALFAQKWRDKTRYRRARRTSVDTRMNRNQGIVRQSSCPSAMTSDGVQSESPGNSNQSTTTAPTTLQNSESGVSLSSADETVDRN